ncbi:helix-turn-helix domain-containing protein [Pedobacter frigoris]|nr:helix-turn-helix transcriptional regulator [Pedobacter frigoris]
MNTVGKKLEFFRLKHQFTQKQVAMVLNIPVEKYSAFESGASDISAVQLARLSEYYEVKIDAFFSSSEEKSEMVKAIGNHGLTETKVNKVPAARGPKKVAKARKTKRMANTSNTPLTQQYDEHAEGNSEEQQLITLLANIIVESTMRELDDLNKLEKSPGGYHYEEKKACVICGTVVSGEMSWYDRNGLKCIHCQKAINEQVIPYWVTKSKDSFYTEIQLELDFGMKGKVLNAFKKAGLIHSRVIPKAEGTGKHFELFLRSDNRDFLPPHKKLRIGGPVKEINADGLEEYVLSYPWYYFVDPIEHLKDYGISNYMRFVPEKDLLEDTEQDH